MSGFSVSNLASQVQNYFVETRDYFRIQTHPKKTEIVVKTITVAILAGLISNLSPFGPLGRLLVTGACTGCAFVVFTRCPDILDFKTLPINERTPPPIKGLEKSRSIIEGIKDIFKPRSFPKSVDQAATKAQLILKGFTESISDALTSRS